MTPCDITGQVSAIALNGVLIIDFLKNVTEKEVVLLFVLLP